MKIHTSSLFIMIFSPLYKKYVFHVAMVSMWKNDHMPGMSELINKLIDIFITFGIGVKSSS